MVIDTSAIIAILREEAEAADFARAIEDAPRRYLSAATLVECAIVVEARAGAAGAAALDVLLGESAIEVVSLTSVHAAFARDAFRHFGRGRHPAALNYGDCFSYALAKSLGEPLLFKGEDFSRTDIESVRPTPRF
ncbi:MAG: type II toxin-antitoxin system VapC family toxin [Vulcanimicrobiaceae bacterium]